MGMMDILMQSLSTIFMTAMQEKYIFMEHVSLPEFLEYWPRLKYTSDIATYVSARREVQNEYAKKSIYEMAQTTKSQTERFYDVLKRRL